MPRETVEQRELLRLEIAELVRSIRVKPIKVAAKKNAIVLQIEFSDGSKAVGVETSGSFIQMPKSKLDPFKITAKQMIAAEKKLEKVT